MPPSKEQSKDTFASLLVELVEDGIASLDGVRIMELTVLHNPVTGAVEELIVGLEKRDKAGILGIRWQAQSVDSSAFDTLDKARQYFAIPR